MTAAASDSVQCYKRRKLCYRIKGESAFHMVLKVLEQNHQGMGKLHAAAKTIAIVTQVWGIMTEPFIYCISFWPYWFWNKPSLQIGCPDPKPTLSLLL